MMLLSAACCYHWLMPPGCGADGLALPAGVRCCSAWCCSWLMPMLLVPLPLLLLRLRLGLPHFLQTSHAPSAQQLLHCLSPVAGQGGRPV